MAIMKKTNSFIVALEKVKVNIVLILAFALISWIISMSADISESSGHGGFMNLTYSWFIAIFTISIYLISRILFKNYNWLITLIGIIYNIYEAINFH